MIHINMSRGVSLIVIFWDVLDVAHMAYKLTFKSNKQKDAIHVFYAFFWA